MTAATAIVLGRDDERLAEFALATISDTLRWVEPSAPTAAVGRHGETVRTRAAVVSLELDRIESELWSIIADEPVAVYRWPGA